MRQLRCQTEHPGGVHIHPTEGPTVVALFERYATGTVSTSDLAIWLNEQGFRTRNMHSLRGPDGILRPAEPRLFTNASVRVILHNLFYCGMIKHAGKLLPGAHEPLISKEVFEQVQVLLKKNSGRSRTLTTHPERQYLLKGVIRCAYCGMPMWAQTYDNGRRYYREHRASRGHAVCPAHGGSISCDVADEQVGRIVEAVELGPDWLEAVLARISLKDEADRITAERTTVQEKLKRLHRAYVRGGYSDDEYDWECRSLEMQLESLVLPEADAARAAGELIMRAPELWAKADLEEHRKLLLSMFDAVYVDTKEAKGVVAMLPKAPFRPVCSMVTTRENSGVLILKQPPDIGPEAGPCSWWRRGRVELPVQKRSLRIYYKLSRHFSSRPMRPLPTESPQDCLISLKQPLSASWLPHPGAFAPVSPPPGIEVDRTSRLVLDG